MLYHTTSYTPSLRSREGEGGEFVGIREGAGLSNFFIWLFFWGHINLY
jgi:hypothetical protein